MFEQHLHHLFRSVPLKSREGTGSQVKQLLSQKISSTQVWTRLGTWGEGCHGGGG